MVSALCWISDKVVGVVPEAAITAVNDMAVIQRS